jgi:hypothetical protein
MAPGMAVMPMMLPVVMLLMAVPIMMKPVVTLPVSVAVSMSVAAIGPHRTCQSQCRNDKHAPE